MTEITSLDDSTIAKIAAGEVIERPASVVKELVENSLDAGANRIDVTVSAGGTDLIRVADDGVGMDEANAVRAVEQHTTSKISSIDDLEAGVGTLGFRGEALHTIGAVSRMTIETRPQSGADVGTEVRVEGGDVTDVAPVGRAPGTTVTVTDLFFNTPARRKYLKRDATEFAHVNRIVSRYALANPDVAISLTHDDNEVFATAGTGDRKGAVLSVYGRDVATSMIDVEAEPDGPITAIRGLVSDPETTRSGTEYVSTYVNGRYVRAGELRDAIVSAYGKQLAADRYPFAVLFLSVPPDTVDVNVHPRKMAVRFDEESAVTDAVEAAVREALLDHGLLRSSAPRGRSAPDETAVQPQTDHSTPPGSESTDEGGGESVPSGSDHARTDTAAPSRESREEPAGESLTGGPELDDPESSTVEAPEPAGGSEAVESGESDSGPVDSTGERDTDSSIEVDPLQTALVPEVDQSETAEFDPETLPPLRILGQIQDTYVVAESPDGLVLIDQHAADERVNYERLQAALGSQPTTQRLVEPVELSVTPQEASQFEAMAETLSTWGFLARLDGERLVVEGVPSVFDDTLNPELLRDVLSSALDGEPGGQITAAADELLADMACYPSITGNTSLRDGAVLELLRALDACENPYACPHGRPTIIELSTDELEDRFERDYPGHDQRRS
ncbi:DNA mismatch repair endonuclease MutL [Halodesulfurarchaeum formicicum]|uniref:DNA mismatch repair protein MutL n=1 Tax=Halodesulfurarchaeum formicicum TaxID=1873524 RepID=A0A1J1AAC2_9EURY|nr:DNA mismatch repair endonuclease MutL [Halodesulfurarchaeum formicicum]APE94723.1 DNA mismatch repair protein MutL [Halodesulfurarchaeum formicicum]